MKTYTDIYEMATDMDNKSRSIKYPETPQKPVKRSYETNTDYGKRLDYYDDVEMPQYRKDKDLYHKKRNDVYELFKQNLLSMLEIEKHPKADKLFSLAWERGHSNGYYEVALEASELVDLLKD